MPRCSRGSKKSAKLVRNCDGKYVCVRYGDPNMSIKKHRPSNKRSFCARHACHKKTDPATPGYQSCKAWDCKTGRVCGGSRRTATKRTTRRTTRASKRVYKPARTKRSRKSNQTRTRRKTTRRRTKRTRSKRRSSSKRKYTSKSGQRYSTCWKGYKRSGWKMKNGRRVPNCVKR